MLERGVYFVSLGCPKNLVDSQVMLGLLKKDQYKIVPTPETAEIIIVNTCSFIDAAKEESISTILDMADYKKKGRCQVLVVSGCLTQRYSKQLLKEMPEVDLFIGTGQYQHVTDFLNKRRQREAEGFQLPPRTYVDQPAFIHTEKDPRLLTGPRYSGYLKISEGCNRGCAFCIIPDLRGKVRSRPIRSLVEEARWMAQHGVRELNLIAQDLTEYGRDFKGKENLEKLLPALCQIEGVDWIRLHYVYPDDFSDELVEIIAKEPKIVKYLDMPIQHTNNHILKSMYRGLTKKKLFDLVSKIRNRIPEMVFRTSIIVGFPGETDKYFEELCQDLEKLQFQYVGVFQYSQEEGTPAAKFKEQVPAKTKRKRYLQLTRLLEEQSFSFHKNWIGRKETVLIEGPSEESDLLIQGRLSTQAQEIDSHVLINDFSADFFTQAKITIDQLCPGDFVEVEITDAQPQALVGRGIKMISRSRIQQYPLSGESL